MKKVKKLTIILTIVLICLVSFIGIYAKKQNIMQNIIKDYDLGMNIEGYREVRLKVSENQEITNEKVEEVKKLIKNRLDDLGAQDYLIKVDYVTGELVLEMEETSTTDMIVNDIYRAGNLKMADSEDKEKVFITNDDIKAVSLKYATTQAQNGQESIGIYLNLEFTEESAKTIKDITTNTYKTMEKEESEEETEENKEEVKQPKLALILDDVELVSSSFDNPITDGTIQLSLNTESTDPERIQESVNTGMVYATILNNGPLPINYYISSNTYIYSEITEQVKNVFALSIAILIIIALSLLVIKYKMPALLAGISYIGFVALYLLVLRYANVVISLEGVAGIVSMLIINYLLIQNILANSSVTEGMKQIGMQLIPVIIAVVIFSFIGWTNMASFGMTMFWGLLLATIYNFTVTKVLLEK